MLLEEARRIGRELVQAFGQEDVFQVLTNDFTAAQQQWVDREEALRRISEIGLSPKNRTLRQVQQRQRDAAGDEPARAYLISDFQKNLLAELPLPDTLLSTTLIPLTAGGQGNLYIDTCWLHAPVPLAGTQARLYVRLRNLSSEPVREGRLTLTLNDAVKAISDFSIEGGATRVDTLLFSFTDTSWNRAMVTLTDYPVTFDDTYYFTILVRSRIEVAEIGSRQNTYVRAVFASGSTFRYVQLLPQQITYDRLQLADFVVMTDLEQLSSGLSATLRELLEAGGNVALFLPPTAKPEAYNEFLTSVKAGTVQPWRSAERLLNRVNLQDDLIRSIFLRLPDNTAWPRTMGSFSLQLPVGSLARPLISFDDGTPALVKVPVGRGWLYLGAVALNRDVSDWVLHPMFAPLLYNMATMRAYVPANAFTIGTETRAPFRADQLRSDGVLLLSRPEQSFIPPQRREHRSVVLFLGQNEEQAGFYEVVDADKKSYGWVAFNYGRSESELSFLSEQELQQLAATLQARVMDQPASQLAGMLSGSAGGLSLWKVSLILALLFLLLEIALLKLKW